MAVAKVVAPDMGEWERMTPDEGDARSIVAASQGVPGSGKSHFWLTAPGPIAWFLFDPGGLKGLKNNPLFATKEVYVRDFCSIVNVGKLAPADRIKKSIEAFQKFQEEWDFILTKVRTLVIDKESLLWEVIRYAFDEVNSPVPKNFHELNLLYRGWVHDAEVNQKNLGLLRDTHDTWGKIGVKPDGKPQFGFTGLYKPDGQKHVPGLVQIQLEHSWNPDARGFDVKILEKCRLGSAEKLMGKTIPDLNFPLLGTLLFSESSEEDWA